MNGSDGKRAAAASLLGGLIGMGAELARAADRPDVRIDGDTIRDRFFDDGTRADGRPNLLPDIWGNNPDGGGGDGGGGGGNNGGSGGNLNWFPFS